PVHPKNRHRLSVDVHAQARPLRNLRIPHHRPPFRHAPLSCHSVQDYTGPADPDAIPRWTAPSAASYNREFRNGISVPRPSLAQGDAAICRGGCPAAATWEEDTRLWPTRYPI